MGKLPEMISVPTLLAIRNGDHQAFVDVYNELHVKIFRFFLKRVFLHETAKELTQQCFIRFWQFRHTLSEDHPLEKQLFIIARTLLINHIKKEAVQKKRNVLPIHSLENNLSQPAPDAAFEISNEVSAAIETLPPVRRKIMVMKTFYGCSNKEIATQLHISIKTVEDHVSKAFRHIRQVIALIAVLLTFHH